MARKWSSQRRARHERKKRDRLRALDKKNWRSEWDRGIHELSQAAIALETNQLLVPFDDSPMGVFDPDHVMPPMPTSLQSAAALRTDAVVRSAIVVPVSYTREQPRKWWQD